VCEVSRSFGIMPLRMPNVVHNLRADLARAVRKHGP
jgi:hypothetical protein